MKQKPRLSKFDGWESRGGGVSGYGKTPKGADKHREKIEKLANKCNLEVPRRARIVELSAEARRLKAELEQEKEMGGIHNPTDWVLMCMAVTGIRDPVEAAKAVRPSFRESEAKRVYELIAHWKRRLGIAESS